MKNLLSSFTKHRHIIHAGYTFAGNGSWILQDGTLSISDLVEGLHEPEVLRVLKAYENSVSIDIHCASEGDWTTERFKKEPVSKLCNIRINPGDVMTSGKNPEISSFIDYLSPFLEPANIQQLLQPTDVVGNIRFTHPTLYVFPGGQGDAALFGINGFNMLIDGGFARKACFWDFARHLDRLDAVLLTRLNNSTINGISAVLQRKKMNHVYPQIGHFFCNLQLTKTILLQDRKIALSPDGDKDKDSLIVNLAEEGQEIVANLRHLALKPHPCYRDGNQIDPVNLYHKVGHGKLDMYVISPARDSQAVKEFLAKWTANDSHLFYNTGKKVGGKAFEFPLQNLVSICALLVWQPANPSDTITRILFPGSTPQHKIFEGLEKLRHLEFLKHPVCTARNISPPTSGSVVRSISKTRQTKLVENKQMDAKPMTKTAVKPNKIKLEKTPPKDIIKTKPDTQKLAEEKKEAEIINEEPLKKLDNRLLSKDEQIENLKNEIHKIEMADIEDQKKKILHRSKYAMKNVKSKVDSRAPSKSADRKKIPEKKLEGEASPPGTPKKELMNGSATKAEKVKAGTKVVTKTSPSATPAKSAKEANNRKVVEARVIRSTSKSLTRKKEETPPPSTQSGLKVERKPISRRTKAPTSPVKTTTTKASKTAEQENLAAKKAAKKLDVSMNVVKTAGKLLKTASDSHPSAGIEKTESQEKIRSQPKPVNEEDIIENKETDKMAVKKELEPAPTSQDKLDKTKDDENEGRGEEEEDEEEEEEDEEEEEEYLIITKEESSEDSEKPDESLKDNEVVVVPNEPVIESKPSETEAEGEVKKLLREEEESEKKNKTIEKTIETEKTQDKIDEKIDGKSDGKISDEEKKIEEKIEKGKISEKPSENLIEGKNIELHKHEEPEDDNNKESAGESFPDEKISNTLETSATTAPTLPEDEKIEEEPIAEEKILVEETQEVVEEKYIQEETKEEKPKEIVQTDFQKPVTPTKFEIEESQKPIYVGHRKPRDVVKTPDEVADLPMHEEVDPRMYSSGEFSKDLQKKLSEESISVVAVEKLSDDHKPDEKLKDESQLSITSKYLNIIDELEKSAPPPTTLADADAGKTDEKGEEEKILISGDDKKEFSESDVPEGIKDIDEDKVDGEKLSKEDLDKPSDKVLLESEKLHKGSDVEKIESKPDIPEKTTDLKTLEDAPPVDLNEPILEKLTAPMVDSKPSEVTEREKIEPKESIPDALEKDDKDKQPSTRDKDSDVLISEKMEGKVEFDESKPTEKKFSDDVSSVRDENQEKKEKDDLVKGDTTRETIDESNIKSESVNLIESSASRDEIVEPLEKESDEVKKETDENSEAKLDDTERPEEMKMSGDVVDEVKGKSDDEIAQKENQVEIVKKKSDVEMFLEAERQQYLIIKEEKPDDVKDSVETSATDEGLDTGSVVDSSKNILLEKEIPKELTLQPIDEKKESDEKQTTKAPSDKESPTHSERRTSVKETPEFHERTSGKSSPTAEEKLKSGKTSPTVDEKLKSGKTSPTADEKLKSGKTSPTIDEKVKSGKTSPTVDEKLKSGKTSPTIDEKVKSGKTSPTVDEKLKSGKTSPTAEEKLRSGKSSPTVEEKLKSGKSSPTVDEKLKSGKTSPTVDEKLKSGKTSPTVDEKLKSGKSSPTVDEKLKSGKTSPTVDEKLKSGKSSPTVDEKLKSGKTSPTVDEKVKSGKTSPTIDEKVKSGKSSPTVDEKLKSGKSSPTVEEKLRSGKSSPLHFEKDSIRDIKKDLTEKDKTLLLEKEKFASGKSSPDRPTSGKSTPLDMREPISGKSTPLDMKEIPEKTTSEIMERRPSGTTNASLDIKETTSGKSTPLDVKEPTSGKSTPLDVKESTSGKITPLDVKEPTSGKSTPLDVKEPLSGKETPLDVKEVVSDKSTIEIIERRLSGTSTPLDIKESLSGKSTPLDMKDLISHKSTPEIIERRTSGASTPLDIKESLSGKSTPLDVKEPTSGKSTPLDMRDLVSHKSTPEIIDRRTSDASITSEVVKEPTSDKSTTDIIEKRLSGTSTPLDAKEIKSGKSSPEIIDRRTSGASISSEVKEPITDKSTTDIIEKRTSGASTPLDEKEPVSEKSTHEKSEKRPSGTSTDLDVKEPISGKSTPLDVKEPLSGKDTPLDVKEPSTSGKSTPLDMRDLVSHKSTPEIIDRRTSDASITSEVVKEPTSDKSTTDIIEKRLSGTSTPLDAKEIKSGKSSPEIIDRRTSGASISSEVKEPITDKSTTDIIEKRTSGASTPLDEKEPVSEKSTHEKSEKRPSGTSTDLDVKEPISGKSTPLDVKEPLSGKDTPLDVKEPSTSGKSTPLDSKDLVSHKSTPEIIDKLSSGTSTPLDIKESLSGKSSPLDVKDPTSHKSTPEIIERRTSASSISSEVKDSATEVTERRPSGTSAPLDVKEITSGKSTPLEVKEEIPGESAAGEVIERRLSSASTSLDVKEPISGKSTPLEVKEPISGKSTPLEVKEPISGKSTPLDSKEPSSDKGTSLDLKEPMPEMSKTETILKPTSDAVIFSDLKESTSGKSTPLEVREPVSGKSTPLDVKEPTSGKSTPLDVKQTSGPSVSTDKKSGQSTPTNIEVKISGTSTPLDAEITGIKDESEVKTLPREEISRRTSTSSVISQEDLICRKDLSKIEDFRQSSSEMSPLKTTYITSHGDSESLMTSSFYGNLPTEDEMRAEHIKNMRKERGYESFTEIGSDGERTQRSYFYDTEEDLTGSDRDKSRFVKTYYTEDGRPENLDRTRFVQRFYASDIPEEESSTDSVTNWGQPMSLPSPAPPVTQNGLSDAVHGVTTTNTTSKDTPKKEKLQMKKSADHKGSVKQTEKRAASLGRTKTGSTSHLYLDLTYVPHHGNSYYSNVEFFKKVRARYYVFSGTEPSKEVYNALLEAKQTWEDKKLEVTIIPTYDTDILGYWVAENEETLAKHKIDLSPSASRCTINLQDHETSCSAYRLEF
ncbi:Microtubule-associated protein 1A, putative [Pediculus humanus corporis]|uniref:Microtubule-associated protein 1A, putative n=1 Tax=Pediculus humanus subsp. corporis TaxID=121224 RepID=E0VRK3_PEDHC|nr:Microtubule-associated protein 1A, putative [Pediculus humanus corporis]EEB16009.1 Microtubule-associated protein 1A, putative [Pediculus humanus corporis]